MILKKVFCCTILNMEMKPSFIGKQIYLFSIYFTIFAYNIFTAMPKQTDQKIPDWVLSKMKQYCAYQERCMFDVKTKLTEFHLRDDLYDKVIIQLKKEDYLNEERFAKVFASGKLRINKWGKNKIYAALQQKRVPELFILEGLGEIDQDEYINILRDLISKKSKELKVTDFSKKMKKLATFAISRGFESRLVWDVLNFKD